MRVVVGFGVVAEPSGVVPGRRGRWRRRRWRRRRRDGTILTAIGATGSGAGSGAGEMVGVRIALPGRAGDLGERVIELFGGDARQVGDPGEPTIVALPGQARGPGGELCDVTPVSRFTDRRRG